MALIDGLVVIAVIIGFGYLIIVQLRKKYPNLKNPLAGGLYHPSTVTKPDFSQQRHIEKRSIL